ncbi:uncharacterized protein V3H82_026023 [Fundulus diaphanus]
MEADSGGAWVLGLWGMPGLGCLVGPALGSVAPTWAGLGGLQGGLRRLLAMLLGGSALANMGYWPGYGGAAGEASLSGWYVINGLKLRLRVALQEQASLKCIFCDSQEPVRHLHNSETNCRCYEPEQGLSTPHNEAVTSYLLGAISASPDLHDVDKDDIVSACKTYYEMVCRSFRYTQPENSSCQEFSSESSEKKEAAGIEAECASG